ncbi:MAG: hypothetical protein CVU44_00300 [Chloroflexi bacterium HGW-Chloroflexi-6]|nr:MAG: hypothetical protein CVU44_00300 [Chloroflexi bacterium HGW-Chloroflexi-6]
MKKIAIVACSFLLLLLGSCTQAARPPITVTPSPYAVFPKSVTSQTPIIFPVGSPTAVSTQAQVPVPTQPDERVYLDPQGWYSFNFPVAWQQEDATASYRGDDGFFETGYLPEMMFMGNNLNVCQWLANISTKGLYSVSWLGQIQGYSCHLISLSEPAIILEVVQNPSAPLSERFLYIKADAAHFGRIANTFTWLRPLDERANPDFQSAPPRPQDTAFWGNTSPLPSSFSLTEYQLPPEAQDANPGKAIFLKFVPSEILPVWSQSSEPYSPNSLEKVNRTIARYGYELRTGAEPYLYNLYQDGSLALENVYPLPDVTLLQTPDTEKLVFFVQTIYDLSQPFYASDNTARYLIHDDATSLWENGPPSPMYTPRPPIWVDGGLLILGLGERTDVQVRNERHDLIFSFETYFGTHIPIERFQAWDNHWILEVSDFVTQDGIILNEKFGFEEVFGWHLLEEKPFYFFRKGPSIGISYDNQFLNIQYDEIIHGYCCGLGLNNPTQHENTIHFFGKRGGVWYYVIVEAK